MAQLGFHGLIGIGLARLMAPGAESGSSRPGSTASPAASSPGALGHSDEAAGHLRWGLVVGSILPDADFFLLGPLYFFNQQLALGMHRSFTHSLVVAAAVLGLSRFRSGGGRNQSLWNLGLGVAIGMAVHALTDLVFWFSGLDWLWPLGVLGLPSYVNLWAGHTNPPVVPKLLGAADYLAFASFYLVLRSRAQALGTDSEFLPRLTWYIRASVALWIAYTILALSPISGGLFDIVHYAVFIVVFLPMILHTAWRMRTTLSAPWTAPASQTPGHAAAPRA